MASISYKCIENREDSNEKYESGLSIKRMRRGSGDGGVNAVVQKLKAERDFNSADARRRWCGEGVILYDIRHELECSEGSKLVLMQFSRCLLYIFALFTSVHILASCFEACLRFARWTRNFRHAV